ncbi:hypothetical protein D3C73_1229930 [compost metagenome]
MDGRQFVHIFGQKDERRVGMIHVVLANLGRQVARRLDSRVQQHGLATQLLGQPGGVEAAQR